MNWQNYLDHITDKNFLQLARCISLIENEVIGYEFFLKQLPINVTPVIGITGPPGAGKSTLVDALIEEIVAKQKTVAVLCVDPSSPFNLGALLGDRIRMSQWYNSDAVYIRSLATRGALGGLHPKIVEITELLKAAAFDYIIIETVGVGQSEIEIAGLADITAVVLVPEAGDEIQTMKAGLMEIANIFIVNKADRPEADTFVKNLRQMRAPVYANVQWEVPVLKIIASTKVGIANLLHEIENFAKQHFANDKKNWLYTQKAFQVIQQRRMVDINKEKLFTFVKNNITNNNNLYSIIDLFMEQKLPKIAGTEPTCVTLEAGKTYAWCTCGLSDKQPFCDGQHKSAAYEENGETIMPFKSLKITAEETKEVWLCNCKQSKNPPYCDGSHKHLK
jgi:LAO/AO transport system kinase